MGRQTLFIYIIVKYRLSRHKCDKNAVRRRVSSIEFVGILLVKGSGGEAYEEVCTGQRLACYHQIFGGTREPERDASVLEYDHVLNFDIDHLIDSTTPSSCAGRFILSEFEKFGTENFWLQTNNQN